MNKEPGDFGLFCNPESRRAEGFSVALGRIARQRPRLIPWHTVLEGGWEKQLEPLPRFLRLESPGRNWRVERQLQLLGAEADDEEADRGWRRMDRNSVSGLTDDPGRVLPMRQWFLGWRWTLEQLGAWQAREASSSRWLCPPKDVVCMFDKLACQQALEEQGISVPPWLGVPRHFDELWESMRQAGTRRAFLKPCHGSSASGVVALEASRDEIQAFTTLELADAPDGLQFYNRRKINVYRGAAEVRRVVDAICGERCLAQVWVPKAGMGGGPFDLRVVVIAGRARHVMMRVGRGPVTNSQLLGGKGDVTLLRRRMGEDAWCATLRLCEDAMAKCFPRSLYAGFDVLIEPDFRTARILEVNAFGDLLPRELYEERDTYAWEVEEFLRAETAQVSSIGA